MLKKINILLLSIMLSCPTVSYAYSQQPNYNYESQAKNQLHQQLKKAMDLGEPPYLISVEQAYYRTLKLLED